MWFKDLNDHADLVKPVTEIKQFLQKHYEKLGRQIAATTYSMLHYCYVMTLKQVSPEGNLPEMATSLRLLESDAGGPIAIHEVSLNKKKPEFLESFSKLPPSIQFIFCKHRGGSNSKEVSRFSWVEKQEIVSVIIRSRGKQFPERNILNSGAPWPIRFV